MTQPDFTAAKQFAIFQLDNHLPPGITYHSSAHTLDEVTPAVDRMIQAEGVTESIDQLLLRTAALFHDLGYISAHLNHEVVSARIAAEELPGFGYSQPQVETIQAMIMATRLPQSPRGLLQEILADADLDILGSPNFFARNVDLRNEMDFLLQPVNDMIWYTNQIAFLRKHHYFTRSTHDLRLAGKQQNLQELTRLLEAVPKAGILSSSNHKKTSGSSG